MPIFTVGAAGTTSDSGFNVAGSVSFESNADVYRTPSSEGNRKKFTISVWIKLQRGNSTATQNIINAQVDGSNYAVLRYENYNFEWIAYAGSQVAYLRTTADYRDTNAWYHIVISSDTDQGTASNRTKMYVNGVQITDFITENYPGSAAEYKWNDDVVHSVGAFRYSSTTNNFFHGYIAEVVNIDGQQLEPTSFGEFDSDSGIWKAKKIEGLTFGSQGFYLDFATRATDPIDASGNGNNFTSSNVLATDYSLDTPTNNYCTLNSLANVPNTTFYKGNLKAVISGTHVTNYGTHLFETGKWYFEALATGGSKYTIGMTNIENASAYQQVNNTNHIVGYHANSYLRGDAIGLYYDTLRKNGSVVASGLHQWVTNDIAMVAIDADNGKIWFGANGTWDNSGDPAAGSGNRTTFTTGQLYIPAISNEDCEWEMNFGSPLYTISSGNSDGNGHGNFEYAVPNGFYAINTKNLAEFG